MEPAEKSGSHGRELTDAILDELEEQEQGGPTRTHDLRKEADEMRQCFTRYAFQAIGLCSLAFAGIFQLMFHQPVVGLFAFGLLPIILAVCRLGTYKYANSNRAYGYELYLEQTCDVPQEFRGRWKPEYRNLSWEEAMQAWRVVQATLFEKIYIKGRLLPDRIRAPWKLFRRRSVWFLTTTEFTRYSNAKYFPSTYLRNLMVFLYVMALGAITLMAIAAGEFVLIHNTQSGAVSSVFASHPYAAAPQHGADSSNSASGVTNATASSRLGGIEENSVPLLMEPFDGLPGPSGAWVCVATFVLSSLLIVWRAWSDFGRCRVLRKELQSIPANALIWQAAVIAHYTAVEKARQYRLTTDQLLEIVSRLHGKEFNDAKAGNAESYIVCAQQKHAYNFTPDGLGLTGYAFWLAQEASSLASNAYDIRAWIANRCAHQ